MKKTFAIILTALLLVGALSACGGSNEPAELETIRVGASITPHAEILESCRDALAAEGYNLEIVEFTDYVQPNLTLESGDLDANYFQHLPYLEGFNPENNTHIVSAGAIHYEPMGIYPGSKSSLDDIAEGDKIAVPNDGSNEARALLLLEANGLIKLREGAAFDATKRDIEENPLNLDIVEMEAAQITISLPDVAFGVVNGNYALQAGLNAKTDALASEDAASASARTYANIIAVREGDENSAKTKALLKVLTSDATRKFIEETYAGSVEPIF